MIAYRDFKPELPGYAFDARRLEENFAQALALANSWIVAGSIEVINVETIGLLDTSFGVRSILVWYRAASPKPQPSPEV